MIAVTRDDIDVAGMIERATARSTGAVVTFVGTVRDDEVDAIEVEVYEEVALRELEEIAGEAKDRFSLHAADVVHRSGRLRVGEKIVVIVTSAGHREEAFAGCRYIIERLKERVPIWKREIGPDGERWVPGEHDPSR
ncbi:MAG: molybdenum cofactor biosynthesis protein MoaE [Methanoregulaceae archaeon]|nr:molybdenum cofactor biosynthesis protein MoaE [Methanoregulaceae archaeon]